MDRGAWQAAVAQSQTRLKRLSMHALVSTHQMPVAAYSLVMTSKNVSGHCHMSLEGREAVFLAGNFWAQVTILDMTLPGPALAHQMHPSPRSWCNSHAGLFSASFDHAMASPSSGLFTAVPQPRTFPFLLLVHSRHTHLHTTHLANILLSVLS